MRNALLAAAVVALASCSPGSEQPQALAAQAREKAQEQVHVASAEADPASEDSPSEAVELMRACGLQDAYALDAWVRPRMLSADFDGDDALDYAAYVRRVSDGARGVAICRAGTWLDVLGIDGPVPGSPMENGYFGMVEAWRTSTMADVPGGWVGESQRPRAAGDVLVLERIEKALYSIYWNGEAFRSHQHYRYVEP